ncbi:MAG: transcription antitermination factor NusB [Victivallales bacterium]|jgi:N utilization substance protein B|nr:transcription antitermination factor NusB [Victivallales bacterium]
MMFDDDELSEKPGNQPHTKRIGREIAMQYLFRCELRNELPDATTFDLFFDQIKEEHGLKDNRTGRKAREYAEKLYLAVALNAEAIDAVIRQRIAIADWELERISHVDRNIMRVALAEMLYMEDIPPVVSINEAVEIARDYSGEDSGSFVNGVLNGVKDTLKRDPRSGKSVKKGESK